MEPSVAHTSPFLLRNVLLDHLAESGRDDLQVLDASRGAANWQQRRVLNAWHMLGLYAVHAGATPPDDGEVALALDPDQPHYQQFEEFARGFEADNAMRDGCHLLMRAWQWLADEVPGQWSLDEIAYRFTEALAGRAYPTPATLDFVPPIVRRYLAPLLFGGDRELAGQFEVIACEGATTGIAQVALTLARNGVISPGDRVAMIWPTYEPLRDLVECQLGCEVVQIRRDPQADWVAPPSELEKLQDPRLRLVVTVSPGNPVPIVTCEDTLNALEAAVAGNPDLLILSDYVYAQFLDRPVEMEIGRLPRNTIGVYSVSKDFGLAGMRLGVVLAHPEGAAQRLLDGTADAKRQEIDGRYCRRALDPALMPLTERLVADSRGVSFTHMSGIATSLQALLCICALYEIVEAASEDYFDWIRSVLTDRVEALFAGLGLPAPSWVEGPSSRYATAVDLREVARARGGAELDAALQRHELWGFMVYLAREWKVILTPGEGFGTGEWSVRACFPSIDADQALELGRRVADAVEEFAGGLD